MSRKLKPTPRFTPNQLQSKLNQCYKHFNYHPYILTPHDWQIINTTIIGDRYGAVLKNTTPYRQFVLAYLAALFDKQASEVIKASTYTVMAYAITEMKRIYQHHNLG